MELTGAVTFVTGAASGIGRACAIAFAEQGADVVLADIDEEGAADVAEEIAETGSDALVVRCDVSSRTQVEHLATEAIDWKGHCDLFMSNAGVGVGGPPERIPLEDWEWVVDTNLWSHIWAVRCVLPHMLERGRGYLVHTASAAGTFGVPSLVPYCVTKFAVVGLAESLAVYGHKKGIGVSVVCPMVVATSIMESARTTPSGELDPEAERRYREFVQRTVKESGIPPEDVAQTVVEGVRDERLYVFPHQELKQMLEAKLADPDAWVRNSADVWAQQQKAVEDLIASGGE